MSKISFIDEDQILKHQLRHHIQKCEICNQEYMKIDFRKCDKCKKERCLRCTIIAGKLGTYCKNCFDKLSNDEKAEISKMSTKLKFWAKNGYYAFIIFVFITIGSFSLSFVNLMYFYIGLTFVIVTFIYGSWLFKYLTQR